MKCVNWLIKLRKWGHFLKECLFMFFSSDPRSGERKEVLKLRRWASTDFSKIFVEICYAIDEFWKQFSFIKIWKQRSWSFWRKKIYQTEKIKRWRKIRKKKKNSLFVNFFHVAKSMFLVISRNIRRNENWKKSVFQNSWSVWMNDWKKSFDENPLLKSVVVDIR